MARYINADKFLDKLLYMGYMDEQKSEVEEVANRMTEDAYTKNEVITMLEELQTEIEDWTIPENVHSENRIVHMKRVYEVIQEKITSLKEGTDVQDNIHH